MPRRTAQGLAPGLTVVRRRLRCADGSTITEERFRLRFRWYDSAGAFVTFERLLPRGTTKTQARAVHARHFAELVQGTLRPTKDLRMAAQAPKTLAAALKQYVAFMADRRPKTTRSRTSLAAVLGKGMGDVALTRLAPFHVEAFQAKRRGEGAAPGTINRAVAMLKHACGVSMRQEWGWISRERLAAIREVSMLPEPRHGRSSTWTKEEVAAFVAEATPALGRVVRAALLTGMRQGEILGLRRGQVDLERGRISLRAEDTKAARPHVLPIATPELRALLVEALEASPPDPDDPERDRSEEQVFTNAAGEPWGRRAFPSYFRTVRLRAGVEGRTFHDLRRTAGTFLVNAGVPIEIVSAILGHAEVAVTLRSYAHLRVDSQQSAMAKLGALVALPAARVGGQLGDASKRATPRLVAHR